MPGVGDDGDGGPQRALGPGPPDLPVPAPRQARGVVAEHGSRVGPEVVPAEHEGIPGQHRARPELPDGDVDEIGGQRGAAQAPPVGNVVDGDLAPDREDVRARDGELADLSAPDAPRETVVRGAAARGQDEDEAGGETPGPERASGRSHA